MKLAHFSIVFGAASLLCSGVAPAAPIDYTTGFEPPQFRVGAFGTGRQLSTQNPPWSLFADKNGANLPNESRIENTVARDGTQALMIDPAASNTVTSGVSISFEHFEPYVTIQADVMFTSSTTHAGWQFAAGDGGAQGGFVGGFFIPDTGRLTLNTPGVAWTGPIPTRDVWTHYTLSFDLKAQTYDLLIDNKPAVTKVPFLAHSSKLRTFQFHTWGRGNDKAYIDNFSFRAASQPPAAPPVSKATTAATPSAPTPAVTAVAPTPAVTAAGPSTKALEQALLNGSWLWWRTSPATPSGVEITFESGGTVSCSNSPILSRMTWSITGPQTVHVVQDKGYVDLTFDASFSKYEGKGTENRAFTGVHHAAQSASVQR